MALSCDTSFPCIFFSKVSFLPLLFGKIFVSICSCNIAGVRLGKSTNTERCFQTLSCRRYDVVNIWLLNQSISNFLVPINWSNFNNLSTYAINWHQQEVLIALKNISQVLKNFEMLNNTHTYYTRVFFISNFFISIEAQILKKLSNF